VDVPAIAPPVRARVGWGPGPAPGAAGVGAPAAPPLAAPHGERASGPDRPGRRLFALVLAGALSLPALSQASAHGEARPPDGWARVAAALARPAAADGEILHAAERDVAEHRRHAESATLDFARYLLAAISDPETRLGAKRGAALLQRFMSEPERGPRTFWSEFSLATLQQMAGEDRLAAATLARALRRAASEDISPATVARTAGFMGHARQAAGMLEPARNTFEQLRDDPLEAGHATVHLGELALSSGGVSAALAIWLSHPSGVTAGVSTVVDAADALWGRDPEASYRLVAAALARVRAWTGAAADPALAIAIERLSARARENAMSPVSPAEGGRGAATDR